METKVPFLDLKRIHEPIKKEVIQRLEEIIDNSSFVLGQPVNDFERDFSNYTGTQFSIGVNSGYDALRLAVQALDIKAGDEVILPANTFIATAYSVSANGATPVLVDVDEKNFNLNPDLIEAAITPKTKAIIPVHLYGQPATMEPILAIAKKHSLGVIEDAAQSHGAKYKENSCGSMADLGCFSFYPGKNLGAMGEGGCVTTNNSELNERLRILRDVGQKAKYQHELLGHNSRLHAMQAAILQIKLKHLDLYNTKRNVIAKKYNSELNSIEEIQLPFIDNDRTHSYHLYVIHTQSENQRNELMEFLNKKGIQSGMHYPTPIHLQKCYENLNQKEGSFPISERLASTTLSLPIFPGMTDSESSIVIEAIQEYFAK